jgi:hypothetical protein
VHRCRASSAASCRCTALCSEDEGEGEAEGGAGCRLRSRGGCWPAWRSQSCAMKESMVSPRRLVSLAPKWEAAVVVLVVVAAGACSW